MCYLHGRVSYSSCIYPRRALIGLESLPKGWKGQQCEDCQETVGVTSRRKSILSPSKKKHRDSDSDSDGMNPDLPPPSTKIRKMIEILEAIYQRTKGKRDEEGKKIPAEKTIVFSQFTTMLDICESFLDHEGIRYSRCELRFAPSLVSY